MFEWNQSNVPALKENLFDFFGFSQREVLKRYVWIEIGNVYLNWIEQKMSN